MTITNINSGDAWSATRPKLNTLIDHDNGVIYAADHGFSTAANGAVNTAALQAALDAASAGTIKTVIMPPGTFTLSASVGDSGLAINLPSEITLAGAGMYATSLEADTYVPGFNILEGHLKTGITLTEFGITQNCDPADYDQDALRVGLIGSWFNTADAARFLDGGIVNASVYSRALNPSEIARLHAEPYCMFWERRRTIFVPVGAPTARPRSFGFVIA